MRAFLGRTLLEIAQVFESADESEERIRRALDLLRRIVPYEQCALLQVQPGREPRLLVVPATRRDSSGTLLDALMNIHARLVNERAHPPQQARAMPWGAHLAVPLVGDDRPIGVLFVSNDPRGGDDAYGAQQLRELSIVGAHLSGYLAMVDQARALDEGRRQAEAANRRKDEFLALVSHELKTPMASTLAWAQMLGSEKDGPNARSEAVAGIERDVRAQAKLVDEILDLACVVTAGLRLDLETVDATSLVREAVDEQRRRAEERSIRVEMILDDAVPPIVVDRARIVQVISSVLAKAIRFTPREGHVGVRLQRVGAHARIQVIDHGQGASRATLPPGLAETADVAAIARLAGIQPAVLPHVLGNLYDGQNPVARAYRELGVGLAIVKSMVEAHGGRVHAEASEEEDASTFTLELPLPADAPTADRRALAGIRVLLVDDDDDMRSAIGSVLAFHGAGVTAVASAAAALEALEQSRPHVLLSDISMPDESGYDLMRKVAARDATLPAAALTALDGAKDREQAAAVGFRVLLAKPIGAEALVAAVATLTGRMGATMPAAVGH